MIQCSTITSASKATFDQVFDRADAAACASARRAMPNATAMKITPMTLPLSPSGPSRLLGTLSRNWSSGSLARASVAGGVGRSSVDQRPGRTTLATSRPMRIATSVLSSSSRDQPAAEPAQDLRGHQRVDDGQQDQRRRERPRQPQDQLAGNFQRLGPAAEQHPDQNANG